MTSLGRSRAASASCPPPAWAPPGPEPSNSRAEGGARRPEAEGTLKGRGRERVPDHAAHSALKAQGLPWGWQASALQACGPEWHRPVLVGVTASLSALAPNPAGGLPPMLSGHPAAPRGGGGPSAPPSRHPKHLSPTPPQAAAARGEGVQPAGGNGARPCREGAGPETPAGLSPREGPRGGRGRAAVPRVASGLGGPGPGNHLPPFREQ